MSSLFEGVLGPAEASTAAAKLFSDTSAFKRKADAETEVSKGKNRKRLGDDAVGKHSASKSRRKTKNDGDGSDDLDLKLRSQADAAAKAAAAAREQDQGESGDDDSSSSSSDDGDEEEESYGDEGEDELDRLAALSGDDDGGGDDEETEAVPSPPPTPENNKKTTLTPEQELERLKRTIFVGNVPPTIKTKVIKRVFSSYGVVESARLRSVPLQKGTSLPRRAALLAGKADASRSGGACAYVVFAEKSSAEKAVREHNMKEVAGNVVRVDFATPPSNRGKGEDDDEANPSSSIPALYDPSRTVFVGNLPPDVKEEELVALFGGIRPSDDVSAVRVIRDRATSLGKGFAFVLLRDAATALSARARDGMIVKGRAVRVRKAARDPLALSAAKRKEGKKASASAAVEQQQQQQRASKKVVVVGGGGGSGSVVRKKGPLTPADRLRRAAGTKKSSSAPSSDWQGMRTKGKGGKKLSRGAAGAPKKKLGGGGGDASSTTAASAKKGKRPSVAARKEAMRVAKARGGGGVGGVKRAKKMKKR